MPEPAYKLCAHCGASFIRSENVSKSQWEGRRFCSRGCAVRWRTIHQPRPRATGVCSECGTDGRLRRGGVCESCYYKARYKVEREHRLAVNRAWRDRNRPYYLQRARDGYFGGLHEAVLARDAHTCQHCGVTGELGTHRGDICVHHIDGDKHHNEMHNLEVLCSSCHSREHFRRGDLVMKPRAA